MDTENVKLTSLDIVAWAYLKEELVNTPGSHEVNYLRKTFPNLLKFVEFMDLYLEQIKAKGLSKSLSVESNEGL